MPESVSTISQLERDIRQSKNVEWVVLNGRLYDATTLEQVAPEQVEAPSYWWQRDGREVAGAAVETR
jgi:hypothetical protein